MDGVSAGAKGRLKISLVESALRLPPGAYDAEVVKAEPGHMTIRIMKAPSLPPIAAMTFEELIARLAAAPGVEAKLVLARFDVGGREAVDLRLSVTANGRQFNVARAISPLALQFMRAQSDRSLNKMVEDMAEGLRSEGVL